MAWTIDENKVGWQQIATTDTVRNHPLGMIVKGIDPVYGGGEFVYLKGVSGTLAGLVVTYAASTGITALGTTSGVATGGSPCGVAMSTNNATTQFGWYQISGSAIILKTAVKVDPAGTTKVYLSATAGRVMQTSVAGRQLEGARWDSATTVTSTTSTAVVTLNRVTQKDGTLI